LLTFDLHKCGARGGKRRFRVHVGGRSFQKKLDIWLAVRNPRNGAVVFDADQKLSSVRIGKTDQCAAYIGQQVSDRTRKFSARASIQSALKLAKMALANANRELDPFDKIEQFFGHSAVPSAQVYFTNTSLPARVILLPEFSVR